MKKITHISSVFFIFTLGMLVVCTASAKIAIVAAENFYGSIAQQIGGSYVTVTSIIDNPNQDPHLFSAAPSTARALAAANIVIYSGADYDPWMNTLLKATTNSAVKVINVGALVGIKQGDNPHIWYNPNYMLLYATKLTQVLISLDPAQKFYYQKQLQKFKQDHTILLSKITHMSKKTKNMAVTATEPVFGYMANLLGFDIKGLSVQWEIMNDVSPSPKEIEAYENNLRDKKVKLLFYNSQVIDPLTKEIKQIALDNNIPIMGVSETLPVQFHTYHEWMMAQLDTLNKIMNK